MQVTRQEGESLPLFAIALLFLYGYTVLRDERGIFYEIIAAREWGARKRDVLDTVALAFLEAGPAGLNLVAAHAERYLDDWEATSETPQDGWPTGWSIASPYAYRSGLDFRNAALSSGEHALLLAWYEDRDEDVPHYVSLLARHRPETLKALRDRIEHSIGTSGLPEQMLPLFRLFSGSLRGHAQAVRAAALQARRLGVGKGHLLDALCWSFVYAEETTMSLASQALEPVLEGWT